MLRGAFEKDCCPGCYLVRLTAKSLVYGLTIGLVWTLATVGLLHVFGVV